MALHMRQQMNMRMEQKLKLTPQMIQSIEILLLPQMALEERIMQEIESNPALDIDDDFEAPRRETDNGDFDRGEMQATAGDFSADRSEDFQRNEASDYGDWLKAPRANTASYDEDSPDKMKALDAAPDRSMSLAAHLIEQLRFAELSEVQREAAEVIAQQLDKRGYLDEEPTDFLPKALKEHAEIALQAVQDCEPAGAGCRNLAECLRLQLLREPGDNSFELKLIDEHLDDILRNRLPVVATAMGEDLERVQEGLAVISSLDPAPGLIYGQSENRYVIPDVIVERNDDEEWQVTVPDSHLPTITVNQEYQGLLSDPDTERREKEYLREKISAAKFIIDAVAQRKRTLLKIVAEIVKHQKLFLEQGPEQLRPLMRQDIAKEIGMHVATVSRAVKDKYMQTPRGVIALADFFSGGIASSEGGEGESSKSVKLRIGKLIENEDKRSPLSDQAIADLLAKDGLDISRRTVTKYRIAEGIPSTRQRRVYSD